MPNRSHRHRPHARFLTLLIPLVSLAYNLFVLTYLLHFSSFPSLKVWSWPQSWSAAADSANGASAISAQVALQVITLLTALYLTTAAAVSIAGFIGVLKNHAAMIRFYRDCAIADLSFCLTLTALMAYGAFSFKQLGVGMVTCEELGRQPDLMRTLLIETESCEQWVERCLMAGITSMIVISFVRLHAILFISRYYKNLYNAHKYLPVSMADLSNTRGSHGHHHRHESSTSSRRVLLSLSTTGTPCDGPSVCRSPSSDSADEQVTVYTPTTMSRDTASSIPGLQEAWVGGHRRHHSHRHHRHHSRKNIQDTWAESDEEPVQLPEYPGEGLLPYGPPSEDHKA